MTETPGVDLSYAAKLSKEGGPPLFRVEPPAVVFTKAFKAGIYSTLSYDITADAQRFLMIERNLEMIPNQLNVVLGWGSDLRRMVPVSPQ